MPGTPFDAGQAALDLLNASIAGLVANGTGAPATAYISPGLPALDCDQLVVHLASIEEQSTSTQGILSERHGLAMPRVLVANYVVTFAMCVQVFGADQEGPPPPNVITAAAQAFFQDAWGLLVYLRDQVRRGLLFASMPGREVAVGPVRILPPNGGLAEANIDVVVRLEGF